MYERIVPDPPFPIGSEVFDGQLREAGQRMASAGVKAVYLAHGTFVGDDFLGVLGELERFFPDASRSWRRFNKSVADSIMGDAANYETDFAQLLQEKLGGPTLANQSPTGLEVHLFSWGGENLHISRADGAVRLLDHLMQQQEQGKLPRKGRVLLWGHSHAGNMLALLSNLLGAEPAVLARFFGVTKPYYVHHDHIDRPMWRRVRERLLSSDRPLHDLKIDMVTFGTPIRYGWDTGGCGQLLHLVNHHPVDESAPYKAVMPRSLADIQRAVAGDYFQHVGIAGTGFLPSIFSLSSWIVEHRLRRFLEAGIRRRAFWNRLKLGVRVAEDGKTLLIDYAQADPAGAAVLAGHAIYTRTAWMAYHAAEVSKRLYT